MVKLLSLRKKLVFVVFVVSSIATTFTVAINSMIEYRVEMSHFEKVMKSIELQNLETISKLSWDLNVEQIQFQIESLTRLPEVVKARVILNDANEPLLASRDDEVTNPILKKYPLQYKLDSEVHSLGELQIEYNQEAVVGKVLEKLAMTIFLNFIKALAISALLMFVFHILITSRIEKLSKAIVSLSGMKFKGGHQPQKHKKNRFYLNRWDEINQLEHQCRRLSRVADKQIVYMENQIADQSNALEVQRAKAAYASKMASLGEMASGLAHEINNPLTIIGSRIHLLGRKVKTLNNTVGGAEEFCGTLGPEFEKLTQLTNRISKIVNGLRFFARDGSKDPKEWTTLRNVVTDSLQLINQKAKNAGVEIFSQVDDIELNCRPVEISQVLINLVGNSLDAISGQSEKWIKIESKFDRDRFQIKITDSGPGISIEDQKNLMVPFYTTKPVGKGTGLGLSISKGIIESHNGVFRYVTESKNTCFQISFPQSEVRVAVKAVC